MLLPKRVRAQVTGEDSEVAQLLRQILDELRNINYNLVEGQRMLPRKAQQDSADDEELDSYE